MMNVLRCDDLIEVPWKNGGGTTREIATGIVGGQIAWRISRADVGQDGDFSDFAGLVRILTVVSGGGMVLKHAGGTLHADLWEPVVFDGGLKVASQLKEGPLTDLNLMFDPSYCAGGVITHCGPTALDIAATQAGICVVHVLAGTPTIGGVLLGLGDTAFLGTNGARLDLSKGEAVLAISLTYLPQRSTITLCITGCHGVKPDVPQLDRATPR